MEQAQLSVSRWTLRFEKTHTERAFVALHAEQLAMNASRCSAMLFAYSLTAVAQLAASDWATGAGAFILADETLMPSTLRNVMTLVVTAVSLIGLVATRMQFFSNLGPVFVEFVFALVIMLLLVSIVFTQPWYVARLFDLDPYTFLENPQGIANDTFLLLMLDGVVTVSHIALPMRWVTLWPVQIMAVMCYLIPAFVLGGPMDLPVATGQFVVLVGMVAASGIGKRNVEYYDRAAFMRLISEKSTRVEMEHKLEQATRQPAGQLWEAQAAGYQIMDNASTVASSQAGTTTRTAQRSIVDTLRSASLPGFRQHQCTRGEMEAAFREGAAHLGLPPVHDPQSLATLLSVLGLLLDTAAGGALVCVADAVAFRLVFDAHGGSDSQAAAGPVIQSSDGGYMTDRLKGVHISDERFAAAFREFTAHSDTDRWPVDHPDEAARGQPKDGAFLLSNSGYRLKCAVKLLGLPPAAAFPNAGTKHQAALACAAAVPDSFVFVKSDSGGLHLVFRHCDGLRVCALSA